MKYEVCGRNSSVDRLGDCKAALSAKLYAGGRMKAEPDAEVDDAHDSLDCDDPDADIGDVGAELLAFSRSASRHACEQ